MSINYKIKTGPTLLPVSLAYVKEHSKIDYTDEDTVLLGYLNAAIAYAEKYLSYGLMTQTIVQTYDDWPDCFILAMRPNSITRITYIDENEESQTFLASNYAYTTTKVPGEIFLKKDKSYPTALARPEAITVEYETGYTDADDVPHGIKQAICLLFGWFESGREDSVKQKKTAAEVLLDQHLYDR